MGQVTESALETEIQAKGLTAPRITPERIDGLIASEAYHRFVGTTHTVCCLTLTNGHTVIGESACVSPENFDAEVGEKVARDDARNKLWALEGYRLKCALYEKAAQVTQ